MRLADQLRGALVVAERVEDRRERVVRRGPHVPVRLALDDHKRERRGRLREHLYAQEHRRDAERGLVGDGDARERRTPDPGCSPEPFRLRVAEGDRADARPEASDDAEAGGGGGLPLESDGGSGAIHRVAKAIGQLLVCSRGDGAHVCCNRAASPVRLPM